ncbi:hypothetical protein CpipJ_CPIJ014322 [Culex quinquefasciatus]|uniref:Uncharacterized protein n=1 Tax=Culex quinquefasciatus TaxID=7176 RepID=B0X574_CULQU|nr:hypothetical protein CpipJ_CPIJ014322 [Culex quinquefasciatus]|eukprot:XP_001864796.1 hypothetical protein CpipJ_CPIJ014322 [Culex quinquefasciatus]
MTKNVQLASQSSEGLNGRRIDNERLPIHDHRGRSVVDGDRQIERHLGARLDRAHRLLQHSQQSLHGGFGSGGQRDRSVVAGTDGQRSVGVPEQGNRYVDGLDEATGQNRHQGEQHD